MPFERDFLTANHWGTYSVEVSAGKVSRLKAFAEDPDPSPIGHGIVDILEGPERIGAPMVRKGWLDNEAGVDGHKRGLDEFVQVSWDQVNRIVAGELNRVIGTFGNRSIYAGSYGWASAGRFHHAQSQLKRFLNTLGGYTGSKNTYSFAAAEVIVPHVLGDFRHFIDTMTSWESIASDCELFVAFGGVPLKNGQISQGGTGAHVQKAGLSSAHAAGVEFVNVSPIRTDIPSEIDADWLPVRPNTDAALLIGLAGEVLSRGLHDTHFLERYTVGFERFAAYLRGDQDGHIKDAEWASGICDLPADDIRNLAQRMAGSRTMISVAWSLTRQDHGEQPFWAAITLAAMLGQIGLPGTGIGFGYSAMNNTGLNRRHLSWASFPQGRNPVEDFIPVARITDMLENPGGSFHYDGKTYSYPDIRLIWWAGGNPFHHHQDLNRLRRAWSRPETIIVNDWCWNPLARHADIVLPCTTTLERFDFAAAPKDPYQVFMDKAVDPFEQARDDHEIFRGLAVELGVETKFTDGKKVGEWQRWMWNVSRRRAAKLGVELPDWDSFQRKGWHCVDRPSQPSIMLEDYRHDPVKNPLKTPSGRIEIFSETVAGFDYDDCPGHPVWMEPAEWLDRSNPLQLHMISNQPTNKLHSQLDSGPISNADRPNGVEILTMHPSDAAERSLADGQIVHIQNARGACTAEVRLSDAIRIGVVQIATGAWLDLDGRRCRRGNPNMVTLDKGTSKLAQGPVAQTCLVFVVPADEATSRDRDVAASPASD